MRGPEGALRKELDSSSSSISETLRLFEVVVAVPVVEFVAVVAVDLMLMVETGLGDAALEFLNAAAWKLKGELVGEDGSIEGGAGRWRLGS